MLTWINKKLRVFLFVKHNYNQNITDDIFEALSHSKRIQIKSEGVCKETVVFLLYFEHNFANYTFYPIYEKHRVNVFKDTVSTL